MLPPGSARNQHVSSLVSGECEESAAMPDKPRSFKERVAAQDPAEGAWTENGESFDDVTVSNAFHREVSVHEDRDGTGEWRVEYFDADGGCYVTVFAGPKAERRARDYFEALKFGRLRTVRGELRPSHRKACDRDASGP